MDRKTQKDPNVWRSKVLVLYRTILQLKSENKELARKITHLERKIKSTKRRSERNTIV